MGKKQLIQGAERVRPIIYPHQKKLYSLTNMTGGIYTNQRNFTGIPALKYKDFMREMSAIPFNDAIEKEQCIEIYNKCYTKKISSHRGMLDVLNYLKDNNLLRKRSKTSGPGRPKDYWYGMF